MSYLYVKWNSFECGPLAYVPFIRPRGYFEGLRRRRRRA
jgi:hypothetical protein